MSDDEVANNFNCKGMVSARVYAAHRYSYSTVVPMHGASPPCMASAQLEAALVQQDSKNISYNCYAVMLCTKAKGCDLNIE
jgi:hypothetical protein